MYTTCIYCATQLGTNEVIEQFPVGRRLAFDAAKGRLWVVCRKCERWNLTPLEERWEAVEDCERRFRDTRKRASTENIGLARLNEGLELVRIGAPLRPEFAAWRYGDQFGRRRRRAIIIGAASVAVVGTIVVGGISTGLLAGGGWGGWRLFDWMLELATKGIRRRRLVARVPVKGGEPLTVRGKHIEKARILPDTASDYGWRLELPHARGDAVLSGRVAVSATGLIMPKINAAGASRRHVQEAVQRIETSGDPDRFLRSAAIEANVAKRAAKMSHGTTAGGMLPQLALPTRLALEMAVNEENERAAMEGELELLEMAWQEAEEIAAIADSLLLPASVEEHFERLKQKRG